VLWSVLAFVVLQSAVLLQETAAPPAGDAASPEKTAAVESTPDPTTAVPADAASGKDAASPNAAKPVAEEGNPYMQFLPILIIGFFFYIILLRPQQREQRRRQELLSAIKKNDKVVTTGGLIGTIADISTDGKTVTLRVDDTTRIKFLRSAIHGPLDEKAETASGTAS
jgi:preprotein translocase subunit YajC